MVFLGYCGVFFLHNTGKTLSELVSEIETKSTMNEKIGTPL